MTDIAFLFLPNWATKLFIIILSIFSIILLSYNYISPIIMEPSFEKWYNTTDTNINDYYKTFLWSVFILQPICGIISDLQNPSLLLLISFSFVALINTFMTFFKNYFAGTVFRIVVGIGCSFFLIPFLRIFYNWFRSYSFVILICFIYSSDILEIIFSHGPISSFFLGCNWRIVSWVISALTIIFGIMNYCFILDEPDIVELSSTHLISAGETPSHFQMVIDNLKKAFKNRSIPKLILLISTFPVFFEATCDFSLVGYIQDVIKPTYNYELMFMLIAIFWIISSILFGAISEFLFTRKNILIFCSIISAITCLVLTLVSKKVSPWIEWLFIVIFGIGAHSARAMCNLMISEIVGRQAICTALGISGFFENLLRAIYFKVIKTAISKIDQNYNHDKSSEHSVESYQLGFWLIGFIFSFIGMLMSFWIPDSLLKNQI